MRARVDSLLGSSRVRAACTMAAIATLVATLVATPLAACGSSDRPPTLDDSRTTASPRGNEAPVAVDPGNAPSQGPASAKVVVIEFGDFECPYCGEEEPIVARILSDYAGRIRFVFKEFPLTAIHPHAELAAEAALAANAQGKFWAFHDTLYANQSALVRADLDGYASALGLDVTMFDAALDHGSFRAAVAADMAQGTSVGVLGTPTFFVNGIAVVGAVPYATLQGVIAEQVADNP